MRTIQRMKTYHNGMVEVLNKHQADSSEAMAASLAVSIRLARVVGLNRSQFMMESESAWKHYMKLPVEHDELILRDTEVKSLWKRPKLLLALGLFSGFHWLLFAAYLMRLGS